MSPESRPYRRAVLVSLALAHSCLIAACSPALQALPEVLPAMGLGGGGAVKVEFGRVYVVRDESPLRMDVFRPTDPDGLRPTVVLVHGGFWLFGQRQMLQDWAYHLAAHGYVAASIDYRLLSAGHTFPAPVADVLAAIAHLRQNAENLPVDPDRIGLFGVSAGSQLALLAAMAADISVFDESFRRGESADVRAVVNIYGPTDFTVDPATAQPWQVALVHAYLGVDPYMPDERLDVASPVSHVRADGPAVLTIHGSLDIFVPLSQAQRLDEALAAAGQPHLLILDPFATHCRGSVWLSPPAQAHRADILGFLDANL